MNPFTFLFVTAVTDEKLYSTSLQYIRSLVVPSKYKVETLPVRGAKSIFSAYNSALKKDAKYKIYLHQDVFIQNRNFLKDILMLFQNNKDMGMLGVIGCLNLPPSGVWWESTHRIGKVYGRQNGRSVLINVGDPNMPFQSVTAIDGLLMATQYDLCWREDLFTGFHFYDISQSAEYRKHGYKVGIPRQGPQPWCNHYHKDVLNMNGYDLNKQIYLRNYGHS